MNASSLKPSPWRALFAGLMAIAAGLATLTPASAQNYGDDYRYDDGGYDRDYDQRDDRDYRDDRYDSYNGEADYRDGQDAPDVSFFYNELADDGDWISHRDYGYVWAPRHIDDDWRPYSRGTWAYTDDHGWYWVSEEPFGWATFHYGRWFHDDRRGWLWIPGTTWGPAWVAWRSNNDYVGWAPLPPDAYWSSRSGLRYDVTLYESPRFAFYWSFIEPRYITTRSIYRYCAPRHRARTIIYSTRPQTNYTYLNANIVNAGISISFIEQRLGAPLTRQRIFATDSRRARGFDRRAGNTIRVWRPNFKRRDLWVKPKTAVQLPRGIWRDVDRPAARAVPARVTPGRDTSTWGNLRRNDGTVVAPQTVYPPAPAARQLPPAKRQPPGFSYDKYRDNGQHPNARFEQKFQGPKRDVVPRSSERQKEFVSPDRSAKARPQVQTDEFIEVDPRKIKRSKQRPVPDETEETLPPVETNRQGPPKQNPGRGTGAFDNLR